MAISNNIDIVYQCDVCNRQTLLPQSIGGLNQLPNCVITLGCLGKLRKVANQTNRTQLLKNSAEVSGLTDWVQRNALYTHIQSISSTQWIIKHNMNNNPTVHLYKQFDNSDVLNNVLFADRIEPIDPNTTAVYFSTPTSGVAQCVNLRSTNVINPNPLEVVVQKQSTMMLSSDSGEITIATLLSDQTVSLTLNFVNQSTPTYISYLGITNVPSIQSPWIGSNIAIINGRQYTIRSFNLTQNRAAQQVFNTGMIPNGTPWFVSGYNNLPVERNQVLMLLGNSPNTAVDRITDRYVDSYDISSITPEVYYDNNKGYVQPSIIRQTYPQILTL